MEIDFQRRADTSLYFHIEGIRCVYAPSLGLNDSNASQIYIIYHLTDHESQLLYRSLHSFIPFYSLQPPEKYSPAKFILSVPSLTYCLHPSFRIIHAQHSFPVSPSFSTIHTLREDSPCDILDYLNHINLQSSSSFQPTT